MTPRNMKLCLAFAAGVLVMSCGGDEGEGSDESETRELSADPSEDTTEDDCAVILQGTPACAEEAERCGTTRVLADGRCCIIGGNCGRQ